MLERGRLPGSHAVGDGFACGICRGEAEVGQLVVQEESACKARIRLTICIDPKAPSIVVVIANALPAASMMLMCDVPYSGWSGMGAYLNFE